MRFNLRQLAYIESAARHRSIAAAAIETSISKSSIAAAIDGFEESYEVTLFIRQPSKGLVLTPAGKRLMNRVRHLIREAQTFDAELTGETGATAPGELILGCFAPLAPQVLPFAVQAVINRYPNLTVKVLEGDLRYVNELVALGAAEMVLSYDLGLPEGATFETFGEARPHVVFCEEDPLASATTVSLAELTDRPMILLDLPESRTYFEMIFQHARVTPNVVFRTSTYQTLRSFVSIGLGYSILNLRPARDFANTGRRVICVPLSDDVPAPKVGVHYRADAFISPAAKAFSDECRRLYNSPRGKQHFVT